MSGGPYRTAPPKYTPPAWLAWLYEAVRDAERLDLELYELRLRRSAERWARMRADATFLFVVSMIPGLGLALSFGIALALSCCGR